MPPPVQRVAARHVSDYERNIIRLFEGVSSVRDLRRLEQSPQFREQAALVVRSMVNGLSAENARTWREAAMRGGNAKLIHAALKRELQQTETGRTVGRILRENSRLIRGLPRRVASELTIWSAEAQKNGLRAKELQNSIAERLPHVALSRIRLIARTEIGKAETAITRARSEQIGAGWYQWATSEDQRVRASHRNMDKVLVAWDDPPSPEALIGGKTYGRYAPGEIFNCRCVSLPLVSLNEVSWPARVYRGDAIVRMTLAQFRPLFERGVAVAA